MTDAIFHFGQHKGKPMHRIPDDYLEWVVHNHCDSRAVAAAESEMERRASLLILDSKRHSAKEKEKAIRPRQEMTQCD